MDDFVTLSNGEKMFFFDNFHEPSNLEISYDHSDDPSGDIYYQRVGIDGFNIGTAQVVNISDDNTQDYPKTLQFEDGSFVVAWSQSIGGSTFAAVYQRFDSEGMKTRYPGIFFSQFTGAELMAEKWNLTRQDLDNFALSSHQKAMLAVEGKYFDREILPIQAKNAEGK